MVTYSYAESDSQGTKSCVLTQTAGISKKAYKFPELKEEDLEETFTRGSGPGGQSVNKTANCVLLKHTPTGLLVKNHESRSLETNRKKARILLREKLDVHLHGDQSFFAQQKKEDSKSRSESKKKAKKLLERKKAFKEREGLD
ncbi:hypothetical protein ScPMuIL_006299 [Solemya velum]